MSEIDTGYDPTNPQHVAIAEDASARSEKEHLYAIAEMLHSYHGRRVFWDLLSRAGVFGSVFTADALQMAFRAGQQDLGHQLQVELLTVDASLYDQMMREGRTRAKHQATATKALLAQVVSED